MIPKDGFVSAKQGIIVECKLFFVNDNHDLIHQSTNELKRLQRLQGLERLEDLRGRTKNNKQQTTNTQFTNPPMN